MANLATMGAAALAEDLDLPTYDRMLEAWNDAHSSEDQVDLPDPAIVQARLDRINADPRLTH